MGVDDVDLGGLVDRRPKRIGHSPATARVIKIEDGGPWVAPLDGDTRHPVGPCRGPASVAVGDVVLLIWTDERPWIAQVDGGA